MASVTRLRQAVTFGSADGLTIVLGLLVSLQGQPHDLFRAAFAAGLAELVGMTAGQYLSDERAGIKPALANGAAAFGACVLPALPYLTFTGWPAAGMSLTVVAALGIAISAGRPERGVLAFATTFGILVLAAGVCWAASLL